VLVGSGILPQTAAHLAAWAKEQLQGRGIEIKTARTDRVSADELHLAAGRLIESHCVIWTAGNRVSPVVAALDLPRGKDGRILVDEFFQVAGWPGVYALGDNAAQVDVHSGQPYVATASRCSRPFRSWRRRSRSWGRATSGGTGAATPRGSARRRSRWRRGCLRWPMSSTR
jgi:NADH dehydrogenase